MLLGDIREPHHGDKKSLNDSPSPAPPPVSDDPSNPAAALPSAVDDRERLGEVSKMSSSLATLMATLMSPKDPPPPLLSIRR